jgi:hypothetical protein
MTQPVGIGAALVIFVNSVLAMLVVTGVVDFSPEEVAAINLVVVNAVALVTSLWAWYRSTPTAAPTLKEGTQVKVTDSSGTRIGTTTVSPE